MDNIAINLKKLREHITYVEQLYGRVPGSVKLLAVSKTQSVDTIRQALQAGQTAFGENYLQEALVKIEALENEKIEWHFIGAIQSNKTKLIAENFSWIHSIDRVQIAERLNNQRPTHLPPLNICLQVNMDNEISKAGVSLEELPELVKKIALLNNLRLRGLMTISAPKKELPAQHKTFRQLNIALQSLNEQGFNQDTLSMGMSDDYLAAIAEGATILRIGTRIFGDRIKTRESF